MRINEDQRQSFVTLLRGARESRGWKQYEAADHIGIPPSTLSRLEHGPYDGMRFEDILLVCHAYGVPVDTVAGIVGLAGSQAAEGDGEVEQLCAAIRLLEAERRTFVLRVVQAVLRGL